MGHGGRRWRTLVATIAIGAAFPLAGPTTPAGAGGACKPGPMPFEGIRGASLQPTVETSKDADPVHYVIWRGFVPSFDGMPLSVDVTVPCREPYAPKPLVVMPHGFTDDKTVWEETGKSDTVDSQGRPGPNSHWNNIWFASQGDTVLTYTARGWHDSCGPDTPGHSSAHPAPQCADHEWWIHLDDQRWEVRDAQWLTGALVQSGTVDAIRLAITGGSYGGGVAAQAALLDDRVVCGGDPVPKALGVDPCRRAKDGEYRPWTTPDGKRTLHWAAAVPMYTFGDLVQTLAPNGRWTDGWAQAPKPGNETDPFGVPLESTLKGLILAAQAYGSLAPPGTDPTSDIQTSSDRLLQGNPFRQDEAVVRDGIEQYRRYKSPVGIDLEKGASRVPIFWVQGLTDALFPAHQALIAVDRIQTQDPNYPIELFFGDLGHDVASEREDEWAYVHERMNTFLTYHLIADSSGGFLDPTPVRATITRCLDHDAPMRVVSAPSWNELHDAGESFGSTAVGHTSTTEAGPNGAATDPISTATLPGPHSYKGCRIVQSSKPDPTVATYDFALTKDLTMIGSPAVDLHVDATGADTPIAVRMWDVDPQKRKMGLVTRGIYRMAKAGKDQRARFELFPQGYRFPKGHTLRFEVTANDSPTFQASKVRSDLTIRSLNVRVPRSDPRSAERSQEHQSSDCRRSKDGTRTIERCTAEPARSAPAWRLIGFGVLVVLVVAANSFVRARRRRLARRPDA